MRVDKTLLPDLQEVPPEDLPEVTSQEETLSGAPVPVDDMPDVAVSGNEVPPQDLPIDTEKYETTGQQILTGVEHAAKGVIGPLATMAEQKLNEWGVEGFTDQDILAREQVNPGIAGISEAGGNIAAFALAPEIKLLGSFGALNKIGKVASKALDLGIKSALIQGGDETSKAMLGVGNPADVVAYNIAKAGGIGIATGSVFGAVNYGASKFIPKSNIEKDVTSWAAGVGHKATFPGQEIVKLAGSGLTEAERKLINPDAFMKGQKAFENMTGGIAKGVLRTATAGAGALTGDLGNASGALGLTVMLEKWLGKKVAEIAGPAVLKAAASGNLDKLGQVINYSVDVAKGEKMMSKAVEGLFSTAAYDLYDSTPSEKDREKLREFIDNGGADTQLIEDQQNENAAQGFAEGGQVANNKQNNLESMYPDQNMLFSAAKMRVSNYLKSKKPMGLNSMRAFDSEHKDIEQEHKYNRLLDLANKPLSVMKHIKKGNLLPQHVDAIKSMYPELHEVLSRKIMEQVTNKVHGKGKPPYAVRQALSLFLGQDLDSSMSPQNIQAAQAVFAQQKMQSPPANSMSGLKTVGKDSRTAEQSREKRLNRA